MNVYADPDPIEPMCLFEDMPIIETGWAKRTNAAAEKSMAYEAKLDETLERTCGDNPHLRAAKLEKIERHRMQRHIAIPCRYFRHFSHQIWGGSLVCPT